MSKKHIFQCEICGAECEAYRSEKKRFCSRACCSKSQRGKKPHNYNPENYIETVCRHCGKTFQITRNRKETAKYCSMKCHDLARLDRVTIICVVCGCPFDAIKSQSWLKTCSRKCQSRLMSGPNSPAWKGGNRRYYYGPNWKEQRAACRERDKHTCRHCGRKRKKGERMFDVHHVRPFRTFGYVRGINENYKQANDLTNLVTLCLSCHVRAEHHNVSFQLALL